MPTITLAPEGSDLAVGATGAAQLRQYESICRDCPIEKISRPYRWPRCRLIRLCADQLAGGTKFSRSAVCAIGPRCHRLDARQCRASAPCRSIVRSADPISQSIDDGIARLWNTGYSAFAEYEGQPRRGAVRSRLTGDRNRDVLDITSCAVARRAAFQTMEET